MHRLRPPAAALALVLALTASASFAARDDALLAGAEALQPAAVETLRQLVLIESGTRDPAGLARMADALLPRLVSLGAEVERRKTSTADVLVGRWTGTGKRHLMLMAHMDTVYAPGILQTQPLRQDGNRLYGPGIADDKGGIAVILHTIQLLQQRGWKDFASLTVVFNADEESGSRGSGTLIADLASRSDCVLSFEPTVAGADGVLLSAAGAAEAVMEVKGKSSHAGASPELGRNALMEAAWQMLQTENVARGIPGAQLNWTMLSTGTIPNQIPEVARATGDVRLTRRGADEALLAALQAKVKASQHIAGTETSVRLGVGRPPFERNDRTDALAKVAQEVNAELGGKPLVPYPGTGAATDAGYAQQSGHAVVLESLGLPGAGYHARDEFIELDSIPRRIYLAARLLERLARE